MMKKKTKDLAKQIQDALLALPDAMLMETLTRWLDRAEDELAYLDWSDEYRYMLGYRVQSDTTGAIYTSFESLDEAEPDGDGGTWVVPPIEMVRSLLVNLSPEGFYRGILPLAGDALRHQAYEEGWDSPPSTSSDGYNFMRCLAIHLRYKYLERQGMKYRYSFSLQHITGRRRPMDHSSAEFAFWHAFVSHQ
ncbi:hypothetical protein KDH_28690 [Dictyobacter sp. S3.2.2.5]|uniref:AbiTii domain-containing protein n=1 Tax=Dictyobacter halimunensis TaxID=3026934 RepID=A0ABQ6FQR5_9CHLR|nr:hypothetical protein KDH_28690 [Dictyobacter sp. S3.2.2.5]